MLKFLLLSLNEYKMDFKVTVIPLVQWNRQIRQRAQAYKRRRKFWARNSTTKPNASLTRFHQILNLGIKSQPTSLVKICRAMTFVVVHQENLGRGEEAEHGNIWSPRTLPEGKRIQGPSSRRVGRRWPASPAENWNWEGVKTFFFFFFAPALLAFCVNTVVLYLFKKQLPTFPH